MKMKTKRILSLLLALVFVVGLLPVSALGAETEAYDQILRFGETGSPAYLDGKGTAFENPEVSSEDGLVTISETIKPTNEADKFDITMKVSTKEIVESTTVAGDAAVVLVIDVSTSMVEFCAECGAQVTPTDTHNAAGESPIKVCKTGPNQGKQTDAFDWTKCSFCGEYGRDHGIKITAAHPDKKEDRLVAAKRAAVAFVNDLAASANGAKRMVSVVQFGNYDKTRVVQNWIDVGADNQVQQVVDKINGLTAQGSTSVDTGLALAENLLKASGIEHKSLVLFCDGMPDPNQAGREDLTTLEADIRAAYPETGYQAPIVLGRRMKAAGATLYSVGYATGPTGLNWMNTFSSKSFSAGNAAGLSDAFKEIFEEIDNSTASGASGLAIPLGAYMQLLEGENTGISFTDPKATISYSDGAINWNLKSENATAVETDGVTIYTYEMTFRVTLDTWADGFIEGQYYPVNKETTLHYVVKKNDAASAAGNQLTFLTPRVRGQIPMVGYAVNYRLYNRTTGEYDLQQKDSVSGQAKLGSLITAEAKLYPNYTQKSGDTTITLGKDTQRNILTIDYDPTPANVVVKHYVTTTTFSDEFPEGKVTATEALRGTDSTGDGDYYLGDAYSAKLLTESDNFKFDKESEKNTTPFENVVLTQTSTTINLYYTETVDTRSKAEVTVSYIGRVVEWALENGKWVEKVGEYNETTPLHTVTGGGKHGDAFTANTLTDGILALSGYAYDSEKTLGTNAISIKLDGKKPAAIKLYYTLDKKNVPEKAALTVTHHYTTTVQNADGSLSSSTDTDVKTVDVYVGETHTIATQTTFDGYDKWNFTEKSTTVEIKAGENTLDLYYTRELIKTPTTVTVNHSYQDYKWELVDITETVTETVITQEPVETTDEETGETTTVMTDVETQVEKTVVVGQEYQLVPKGKPVNEPVTVEGLFAGDPYTAQQKNKDGYALTPGIGESQTIAHLAEKDNIITFNYERIPAKPDEDCDVTVIHVYRTYMKYVDENGVVHSAYVQVGEDQKVTEATQTGVKGEWFMALPVTTHGDNTDYSVLDDKNQPIENAPAQKVTFAGFGAQHVITYGRFVDEREPTTLKVIPVYISYKRVIDAEGKDVVVESGRTEDAAWSPAEVLYQGQSYSINPDQNNFQKAGFGFSSSETPADTYQNLRLNGNTVYLYYTQVTPVDERGAPVDVVVRHNYSFVTKEMENGKYQETTTKKTETENAVKLYPGQTFKTAGLEKVLPGYTWADPKPQAEYAHNGENITIDFFYTGESDTTQKATLTVTHYYSIVDQDGIELLPEAECKLVITPTGDNFYATAGYTVSPEYKNDSFTVDHITTKTHNGKAMIGFDLMLEEKNEVVITYVKTVNIDKPTTVTVVHNYAELDLNGNKRTEKGSYTEIFSTVEQGAMIGKPFHATLRPTNTANRSEEDLLHTFEKATVAHGALEAAELKLHAEDATKTEAVVLTRDGATITINYLRTVDTTPVPPDPGPGPDYNSYRVTVRYMELGTTKTLAESYHTGNIREGRDYDVSAEAALAISGYAIDHVEGKTAGTIRGNVVVTVWYTVDDTKEPGNPDVDPVTPPEEEIVDEDVPLTDLPGVDRPDADRPLPPATGEIIIVDDGIPMGNLPQTGTTRGGGNAAATLLGLGGLVSALGAGMLLKGKRKEEN